MKNGNTDMVSFAKLFIFNPDLPERLAKNAALADWDEDTFYIPGAKGYNDYPTHEDERSKA